MKKNGFGSFGKWDRSKFLYVILIYIFFMALALSAEAVGSLRYYNQAQVIIREMDQVMIKYGICVDKNDCVKRQVLYADWESWGIRIGIYGIRDRYVLNELVYVCSKYFFENNTQMEMEVNIYPVSKAAQVKALPWNKPKPIKILMKGGNDNAKR